MKKNRCTTFFLILMTMAFCLSSLDCTDKKKHSAQQQLVDLSLIPKPDTLVFRSGFLNITNGFNVSFRKVPKDAQSRLNDCLTNASFSLGQKGVRLSFTITEDTTQSFESYVLKITTKGISIKSPSETGLFYGVQTLRHIVEKGVEEPLRLVPCLEIKDAPRFAYRGLHMDVSRHFFSIDFLKKQIDLMAYYKLNRFHWHLTDGPGWRIQIRRYPELTDIAAWRTHSLWKHWWGSRRKYVKEGTKDAYGGYYTQTEARELVRYAAERHITIIPEIEMPGHSEEVLAVYPHLSCTQKPYSSSEFCIGNEATFEFLENVLSEIIDIFPSEYIHIGGDEASKEHWKKCALCQKRIKDEKLKDEAELQSYLIRRIERFLHYKGRKLIGWDEILEGGLDKSAVVMAWRGEEIGLQAVRDGYNVIMTPGAYCYFDSYQGTPDTQPEAIGGFLPVKKVYSYNVIPDSLSFEEQERILGVQANLWTEYVPTEGHAEYMLYPRLLALAEVAWSSADKRDWCDFKPRVNNAIHLLKQKGYNPYTLSKEPFVSMENDSTEQAIKVSLSSELYPAKIYYTTNGTMPDTLSNHYQEPILIKDSALLKARLFRDGQPLGKVIERRVDYHKAIGKKVSYLSPYSRYYPAGGEKSLVDGLPGGLSHGDGYWQGFNVPFLDIAIDLEQNKPLHTIRMNFLQNANAWIWFPKEVHIFVSNGEEEYREIATLPNRVSRDTEGTIFQPFVWKGKANARYIRIKAPANGGWLFLDEVVVW